MSVIVTKHGHVLAYRKPGRFHSMRAKALPPLKDVAVKPAVDLRPSFPGISDQAQIGACTAFGTDETFETIVGVLTGKVIPVRRSKLFSYAVTRMAEGSFPADDGATMADEFACGQADGFCSDPLFPYSVGVAAKPGPDCYQDALKWRFPDPSMVPGDAQSMKTVLSFGRPIGISLGVTTPFEEVGADGRIAVPSTTDQVLGGHGLCCLGYNAYGWIVANSWSMSWGDQGFCYLQYGWETSMWERYTDASDSSQWTFPQVAA